MEPWQILYAVRSGSTDPGLSAFGCVLVLLAALALLAAPIAVWAALVHLGWI